MKISQCMIVKNEEKNIERALAWGKGIVQEQIVVDTGSTDRTVQIAEKMGARVYHFQWIDDFAAAKNYAIEQAGGDWIIFLDADEYFVPETAQKLPEIIALAESLRKGHPLEEQVNVIRSELVNLDGNGEAFLVIEQDRIFRNVPFLRYQGAIHEHLEALDGNKIYRCNVKGELPVYHTGYAWTDELREEKAKRNEDGIRKELEKEPDNALLNWYLSETLVIKGAFEEAMKYAIKASNNEDGSLDQKIWSQSYTSVLRNAFLAYRGKAEYRQEVEAYYNGAIGHNAANADYDYYFASYLETLGEWDSVARYGEQALEKLEKMEDVQYSDTSALLANLFKMLTFAYMKKGEPSKVVHYATLALQANPYAEMVTRTMFACFQTEQTPAGEVVAFLAKLYHYENPKDVLYLLKCAKLNYMTEVELMLASYLPEDIRKKLYPQKA